MTKPVTLKYGKFLVLLGDGASPESFGAPCGFTDKSLELKANANATTVPDCDDPDSPAWEDKTVTVLSATVTGQGVMAAESHPEWRTFLLLGQSRNVRVQFADTLANNGGYYQGAAVLTSLKFDASIGDKVKLSVNLENDGPWTWVDQAG